jgi:hypothetical protein
MLCTNDDIHRRAGQPMEMDWRSTQGLQIIARSRKNILWKLRNTSFVPLGENVGNNASICGRAGRTRKIRTYASRRLRGKASLVETRRQFTDAHRPRLHKRLVDFLAIREKHNLPVRLRCATPDSFRATSSTVCKSYLPLLSERQNPADTASKFSAISLKHRLKGNCTHARGERPHFAGCA